MSKKLTILLQFLLGCTPPLFSQVILPANERELLLTDMQTVIENTENEPRTFDGVQSPFVEEGQEDAAPQPTMADQPEQQPVRVEPVDLSDTMALKLIGQQFKPLGSLVLGNRGILQLSNGSTIAQGASFTAQIKGRKYEVTIEEVTRNGYTLRIGSAVLSKSFLNN